MSAPGAALSGPVRQAFVDALARRMADHEGPVRAWLEQRLRMACAAVADSPALPDAAPASSPPPAAIPRGPGPLAELTALLDRSVAAGLHAPEASPARAGAAQAAPPELRSLQRDRATWARLSVDQELQRALAQVPDNPGPLNSHLLVLRSLRLMQTLSPDYLARFVSQLETLVWLDQASTVALPVRAPAVRREPAARRPRSRGGKVAGQGG